MKHYPYLSNNNPMTIFFFNILIQVEEQKEIFSGKFFTSMFETTVNDATSIPYYVDMIIEHEDMVQLLHQCLILAMSLIPKSMVYPSYNHLVFFKHRDKFR